MSEVRIQRWAALGFPVDTEAYKARFGNRFRRVGAYTQGVLMGAAAVLDQGVPVDLGVFLGSGLANLAGIVPIVGSIHHPTHPRCSPLAFASSVANAPAFHLAQAFDLHGHNITVSQEEISFEAALLEGVLAIGAGVCRWALVGAVDVPYQDEEAQRVRIGAVGVPGTLGAGVAFVLLGPEGRWRLDEIRIGRFDPTDLPAATRVLPGWTCQELPLPDTLERGPCAQDLFGAASGVQLVEALEREEQPFALVQFHRDGIWARTRVSR